MSLLQEWQTLDPEGKRHMQERLATEVWLRKRALWNPYPWQEAPGDPPTQGMWLMLGGRGTGKTDGAARYVVDHVHGPPCDTRIPGGHRLAIIAPTLGDAVESCVNGPSGLKAHDPSVQLRGGSGGTFVRWPSGAEAKLFGAHTPEDVERLRSGGNRCLTWLEEAAAMRYLGPALDHARFGLRIGTRPHFVASTTPKPRAELVALLNDPRTLVTRGRTRDAVHLDASVRAEYESRYAGTRLGRQELEGELLTDVPGALWNLAMFEQPGFRLDPTDPATPILLEAYPRGCVAIDPAVTSGEDSDGTGIVAACTNGHGGIVLASKEVRDSPARCMRTAVDMALAYDLDHLVVEKNNGGDYLVAVAQQVIVEHDNLAARSLRVHTVTATRGKAVRAQPIAGLYEQDRIMHLGQHPSLETELTSWVEDSKQPSPNMLDALVWALSWLMLGRPAAAPARSLRT